MQHGGSCVYFKVCCSFQTLGKVYAVLSDAEQRAVYDEQGVVDEESDSLKQERDWDEYWRLLFPKVTHLHTYTHCRLC